MLKRLMLCFCLVIFVFRCERIIEFYACVLQLCNWYIICVNCLVSTQKFVEKKRNEKWCNYHSNSIIWMGNRRMSKWNENVKKNAKWFAIDIEDKRCRENAIWVFGSSVFVFLCARNVCNLNTCKYGSFSDWSPLPIQCRHKMCKCVVENMQSTLNACENNHQNHEQQGDSIHILFRIKWNGIEMHSSETSRFPQKAADDNVVDDFDCNLPHSHCCSFTFCIASDGLLLCCERVEKSRWFKAHSFLEMDPFVYGDS